MRVPSSGVTSPGFWNLFYNWWTIRTEMNRKLAYMLHWNPPLWYWEGTFIFKPFWHNFLGQFVSKIGKYCLGWLRLFSNCHIFPREGKFQSCEGTSTCEEIVQKRFKIVEKVYFWLKSRNFGHFLPNISYFHPVFDTLCMSRLRLLENLTIREPSCLLKFRSKTNHKTHEKSKSFQQKNVPKHMPKKYKF